MTDSPEPQEQKKEQEQGRVSGPSFDLPISGGDFADIIDRRVAEAEQHNKTNLDLEKRRKQNENFWKGKQVDENDYYDYQRPLYQDNLIFQDEEHRISIISSKMPDILVTPADQTKEKIDHAKTIEKGLRIMLSQESLRRTTKDGLRHHDLYFLGCIKVRWSKDINDITHELVNPKKLIFDHTAIIPQDGFTADNMDFIVEWIEEPVAQVISKFPAKKEEILASQRMIVGTTKQLNSKMRYQEVWFSFYGKDGKIYEGTGWKYKKTVLGKELNSYFDWEGYEKADEKGPRVHKLYRNHFNRPRKPYIFFTYQNLGQGPIDDTTVIEQAIPIQKMVNKRGRQITEIANRTIPKLAAIADAISKEELRRTTNDPDEHIWLSGNIQDIRAALMDVTAQGPSPVLFQDLLHSAAQIDAKFATQATTRGATVPQESGVSKQITREGDLASHDDMSRIVVERVVYELANWYIQLMKLFYDKDHFIKDLGKEGEMVDIELKRDIIDDNIAVNVKASSVDKQQKRFDAQVSGARRMIDPLSYWEDMDAPNPKERTRRLIAFLSGQFDLYSKITDLVPPENKDTGDKEAEADIERIKEGEEFEIPKPTPKYVMSMIKYVNSPDYQEQSAAIKKRFKEYVKALKEKFQKDNAQNMQLAQQVGPDMTLPIVPGQQPMGVPSPAPITATAPPAGQTVL